MNYIFFLISWVQFLLHVFKENLLELHLDVMRLSSLIHLSSYQSLTFSKFFSFLKDMRLTTYIRSPLYCSTSDQFSTCLLQSWY